MEKDELKDVFENFDVFVGDVGGLYGVWCVVCVWKGVIWSQMETNAKEMLPRSGTSWKKLEQSRQIDGVARYESSSETRQFQD